MNVVKIEDLKKFSVSEVCDLFGVESSDVVDGGVYNIRSYNDRGLGGVESVERVGVVNGEFKIEDKDEMIDMLMKDIGGFDEDLEYMEEFVDSGMSIEYDGVYSIIISEDEGYDIVMVEKQR